MRSHAVVSVEYVLVEPLATGNVGCAGGRPRYVLRPLSHPQPTEEIFFQDRVYDVDIWYERDQSRRQT